MDNIYICCKCGDICAKVEAPKRGDPACKINPGFRPAVPGACEHLNKKWKDKMALWNSLSTYERLKRLASV